MKSAALNPAEATYEADLQTNLCSTNAKIKTSYSDMTMTKRYEVLLVLSIHLSLEANS